MSQPKGYRNISRIFCERYGVFGGLFENKPLLPDFPTTTALSLPRYSYQSRDLFRIT